MPTSVRSAPGPEFEVSAPMDTDVFVRNVRRIMFDQGKDLAGAAAEMLEMGIDPAQIEGAVTRIREKAREVQTAQNPRAVVAGNIESWYTGPRAEDPNWPRLVDLLRAGGAGDDQLRDLDASSTKIVAQIPNPAGDGVYNCRGLVLGYVQSGKTTNFTAVIAKAADAGYRLIIVLSGMHDALRNQTQDRLNEQLWEQSSDLWHRLTNETDFRATASVDALLAGHGRQRVLAVVKKNGDRLGALQRWLAGARPEVLAACPVLVIDDEADQASPNTAKAGEQPKTINRLIRAIVNKSPRSAYIGYTATPFANVLIDPQDYDDLYPRDFIVDLPRPDNYLGAEAVFGRNPTEYDEDGVDDGHDLIRTVPENEIAALVPRGAAAVSTFDPEITPSLDEALRYFLLSSAARRARGRGNPHATALVHTSQNVIPHQRTAAAVQGHLAGLANRIGAEDQTLLDELRDQWIRESDLVTASEFELTPLSWNDVSSHLTEVSGAVTVITDNSRSTERLHFHRDNPRVIVAVGGNTLSRGLTLEGLAVSYFVRSASAYDTLLQMGRWFGYRDGYADLTRIWMTDELRDWFRHLATVEHEIRADINRYEQGVEKPAELGVRIRTHPQLAVTAAAKMRNSVIAEASYSGRRLQTIQFNHTDLAWLAANERAARRLVAAASGRSRRTGGKGVSVLVGVPAAQIMEFLKEYTFHPNSHELNSDLICKYIRARNDEGELASFNVALMGRRPPRADLGTVDFGTGELGCINRARMAGDRPWADIKALMSPADRTIDLSVTHSEVREMTVDRVSLLRNPAPAGIGDGSGLILLYPVSQHSTPEKAPEGRQSLRRPLNAVATVIGVGMVFPVTASGRASVNYVTADIGNMPGVEVGAPNDLDLDSDAGPGTAAAAAEDA